jgi:hypothetical protein
MAKNLAAVVLKSSELKGASELTTQSFAASIHDVLRSRFPRWAASIQRRDIEAWLKVWGPLPAGVALCVREWARAYHDYAATRESGRSAARGE